MVGNHWIDIAVDSCNKITYDSYGLEARLEQFKGLARDCQYAVHLQEAYVPL